MTSPLVIEASGTHREVGLQVGEAGREIIAWGLDAYAARFEGLADLAADLAVRPGRFDDQRRSHGRHPTPVADSDHKAGGMPLP